MTFWDAVRTSRRSPAVGSAAGSPVWTTCCSREPQETRAACFQVRHAPTLSFKTPSEPRAWSC